MSRSWDVERGSKTPSHLKLFSVERAALIFSCSRLMLVRRPLSFLKTLARAQFFLKPVPGPGIWRIVTSWQAHTGDLLEDDVQILYCSITSRYCAAKGSGWNPAES